MPISFDNIRIGKKYFLSNYGEESEFEVLEWLGDEDYKLKDLNSLEIYTLNDLIKYGKSEDFDIYEIRSRR
ncbi:hypothetical protein [Catalinimonas niigatensis]|uniref:hypothetical protein n=1 Tax=Catalinimonas niigatensis TaxID=1397264 RepID=UPI002666F985|nr:hypothetical protein [Catalinimonas niigatensis]WPP52737.1 hypothetical protein PZB72_10140 [Catalinimonas niigatensis]